MKYSYTGNLNVKTFLAADALPTPGALVRVFGVEEENRETEYSRITDVDGATGIIPLPAPPIDYSLYPHPAEHPYALYDVTVSLAGYYPKRVRNVAVFADHTTILPVNMIPASSIDPPRNTLDSTSRENPYLE